MITEMLRIDNTFDDLPVSDCKKQRQLVLSEKVDAYFAWIKQKYAQVTPNGSIGKAPAYSINQENICVSFSPMATSLWTITTPSKQSVHLLLVGKILF